MEPRSRERAAGGGLRHALSALSVFYLALLAWLAAIALLPALLGWIPYVITSGSMAPRIPAGTVLVAAPPPPATLAPGGVIVFADASGRKVTHRVVGVDPGGRYRTKGDANPSPDPAPVDHGQVQGVGRIVVPLIGLPVVWALQGRWLGAALVAGSSAAACWAGLATLRPRHRRPREGRVAAGGARRARRRTGRDLTPRHVPTTVGAVVAVVVAGTAIALAGASFVAAATQPSNRWSAANSFEGFVSFTASDLPPGAGDESQEFTFALGSTLPGGASVVIDLTEAFRGPVDYRGAAQPLASLGQATLEIRRGNSPMREAEISWQPPAGGLPGEDTVTITIPSGITTGGPAEDLPAVATRTDSDASRTALFAVR